MTREDIEKVLNEIDNIINDNPEQDYCKEELLNILTDRLITEPLINGE